jgi:hypothetical protein
MNARLFSAAHEFPDALQLVCPRLAVMLGRGLVFLESAVPVAASSTSPAASRDARNAKNAWISRETLTPARERSMQINADAEFI